MKTLVMFVAIAQAINYPCQSIDPANCAARPSFQSVASYSFSAGVVLTSSCTWCGKVPS